MTSVLYLATSGQVGGAERCLLSCASGLARDGRFRPEVLVGSRGPLLALLAEAGVAAHLLPLPAALRRTSRFHPLSGLAARTAPVWQAPLYARRLRRAVAALQPGLLHSNGLKMHLLAAMAAAPPPLIWHLHDFPLPDPGSFSNRLLQHFAPRAAAAVANSRAVAAAYAERVPALAGKLRTIPNGMDPDALAGGDRAAFRQRWQLPADALVFGITAILAPWKGHDVFLEAARAVHRELPQAHFLIVGDDVYDTHGHGRRRSQLEVRARDLGLADAVRFTGYLQDGLADAYAACDVAVHASTLPEPFGRTAIEAMAAGVPLVAAAAGGMLEIVEPEHSGLLTPPGDAGALAAALLRLAREPELRARLIAGGRQRVRERFSESAINAQWLDLYQELPR